VKFTIEDWHLGIRYIQLSEKLDKTRQLAQTIQKFSR
jgi:hypothetical protein